MLAQTDPRDTTPRRLESGPSPHAGICTVRADHPSAAHSLSADSDRTGIERVHRRRPSHCDTVRQRALNEQLMQYRAPNTQTMPLRKAGRGRGSVFQETDAVKWEAVADGRDDAEEGERRHCVGHEAFATSFIDRRLRAIGDDNLEAAPSRRDCCRESGRSAADHEDVGFIRQPVHRLPTDENHFRAEPRPHRQQHTQRFGCGPMLHYHVFQHQQDRSR